MFTLSIIGTDLIITVIFKWNIREMEGLELEKNLIWQTGFGLGSEDTDGWITV